MRWDVGSDAYCTAGANRLDLALLFWRSMSENADALARIEQELKKYVHPLLDFRAQETEGGRLELVIDLKQKPANIHTYYLEIHPRDLEHPQFAWTLQRMIFEGLHDYFVEMFVYTPQSIDNPDVPYEMRP